MSLPPFVKELGLTAKKAHGQHFLTDDAILQGIATEARVDAQRDLILEVGPGPGTLTKHLVAFGAPVVAVEIDNRFAPLVQAHLDHPPHLHWIEADVLSTKSSLDPEVVRQIQEIRVDRQIVLIANLPYNIAVPLISNLIWSDLPLRGGVVTVQAEVGSRCLADPGSKAYGPISVLMKASCLSRKVRVLKPGCFWPPPKVTSMVVGFDVQPGWLEQVQPAEVFREIVAGLFRYRRKGLSAALRHVLGQESEHPEIRGAMEEVGRTRRPESLQVSEFVTLARAVFSARTASGVSGGNAPGD